MGGSSRVSKTDWTPLYGREVIVWPDNDKAGYKAADEICSQLRKVGVKSLKEVDRDLLTKNFPEKWDLADPLPQNVKMDSVLNFFHSEKERAVPFSQLAIHIGLKQESPESQKLLARDILCLVDERLRPGLEEKNRSRYWEVNNEIISEVSRIFSRSPELQSSLIKTFGFTEEIAKRVAIQEMYHQASQGKPLSEDNIFDIKQALSSKEFSNSSALDKDLGDYIKDKSLFHSMDSGVTLENSNLLEKKMLERDVSKDNTLLLSAPKIERNRSLEVEM